MSSPKKLPPPPRELKFVVKLVVYGRSFDASNSHSFLVDDVPAGTSTPIGELALDIRKMTLKQLRPIIEYDRSGHMDKRSMMFQEANFLMSRLPNHYNRPKQDLHKYLFGLFERKTFELILIEKENEETPIADLVNSIDFFAYDLAIVPLSQIEIETIGST